MTIRIDDVVRRIMSMDLPERNVYIATFYSPVSSYLTFKTPKELVAIRSVVAKGVRAHCAQVANEMMLKHDPFERLEIYAMAWKKFSFSRSIMVSLLNKAWALSKENRPTKVELSKGKLEGVLNNEWRETVLANIEKVLVESLAVLVDDARNAKLDGDMTRYSRDILVQIIRSLGEPDDHEVAAAWHGFFAKRALEYYQVKCARVLACDDFARYLTFCQDALDLEEGLSIDLLHATRRDSHAKNVVRALINDRMSVIIEVFPDYMKRNCGVEMRTLYRLVEKCDKDDMKPLVNEFTVFAIMSFKAAFAELKEGVSGGVETVDANRYCASFLTEYGNLHKIVTESLEGDQRFEAALKKSASAVLNDNVISPKNDANELTARNVARFCHNLLADPKMDTEALVNDPFQLRGAMLLFSMVASKDVFCTTYKSFLMVRLLRDRRKETHGEMAMINLLRAAHDTQFATALRGMIRDMDLAVKTYGQGSPFLASFPIQHCAPDSPPALAPPKGGAGGASTLSKEMVGFRGPQKRGRVTSDVELDPLVLTKEIWPFSPLDRAMVMHLPDEIENISNSFKTRFSDTKDGKEVEWIHPCSHAVLELRVGGKMYRVTVNHPQAAVLMICANAVTPVTEAQLADKTGMFDDWLRSTISSLTVCNLLQYNTKNKQCRLNPSFKAASTVLNATVKFSRPVQEVEVDSSLEESRGLQTQAAIVRIMKSRKVLDHTTLCEDVVKQTSRFFPQTIDRVKRQIEKLINGPEQYLERTSARTYSYVTGVTNQDVND